MTNVVIVEDDHDGAEVLEEYLRLKGINVLAKGYNGLEAVQLYQKFRPDYVLLDMLMPIYDGFYGLRKIQEFDSKAKVIVLSASVSEDEKEKLIELGVTAIFQKPYEIDSLVARLESGNNENKVSLEKNKNLSAY
jgi:two-component system, chemotaxis family, chemotaxis protein CheY